MNSINDTIAAIATPLGKGGLGVIRLSGPKAFFVADKTFRCTSPLSRACSHTIHHGHIVKGKHKIDDALASVFKAPRSYTGENVVEISCHGSTLLLKRVLDLCLSTGARLADPGEFTKRAFLNNKMDLAQAEAVVDLIAAQSDTFRRLAMEQRQGRLSAHIEKLRKQVVELLAQLEANLDFVEDEIPALSQKNLLKNLRSLEQQIHRLIQTAPQGRLLREGIRGVMVGKPNTGKSSLFNALLNHDRAIVTEVPGTTRDTLEERIVINDVPVILTDTAGLRSHTCRVESEGIARAQRAIDTADIAIMVLDISQPPSQEDREVIKLLKNAKVVFAFNKQDLVPKNKLLGRIKEFQIPCLSKSNHVLTSAVSGQGINPLEKAILIQSRAGCFSKESAPVPTVINVRHESLLKEASQSLQKGIKEAGASCNEECITLDLRKALDNLNQITGKEINDEILHAIFSRFCVGK